MSRDPQAGAGGEPRTFRSFAEFYPYYLDEHRDPVCRRLHYLGSVLAVTFIATGQFWWMLVVPVVGYGFAWTGHFFFEKNRPATFRHPLYSLAADWVMLRDALTGRIPP